MNRILFLASAALLAAPLAAPRAAPRAAPPPASAAATAANDQALARFFDDYDKAQLARSPQSKAYRGIVDADYGRWDDDSDAHDAEDQRLAAAALAEMKRRFAGKPLSEESRLSFELFEADVTREAGAYRFRDLRPVFTQDRGPQDSIPSFLINIHKVTDARTADAYVARLRGVGASVDQSLARARTRAAAGVLSPKWAFPHALGSTRNLVTGAPFGGTGDSPLRADLKAKLAKLTIPQAEKDRILADGDKALVEVVKPAFDRVLAEQQAEQARAGTDDGVWRYPDGAAYYAERLRYYTTTGMTAAQVHQLGLEQVARVHGEMKAIMARVGFKGTLPEFFRFVRGNPKFYAPNDEAGRRLYLSETETAKTAVTAKLPAWFGTLPQAPLTVKPVEPFREKSAGKAFYQQPAPDGSRPGVYYVNLYDMKDMPLIEVEALFYHEGVPGHHLQLAIQSELKDLPAFRRFGGFTAYIEGWGLYSERLAKDMGLYEDPYRDFGRLQLELHRAIRLVVDTGLHDKRWTRERAIQYVQDNSADAPGGIVKAIERYSSSPGQATAYMIGRLRISALRDRAQATLGPRYDVRGFHDVVLRSGPVPLDILERRVDAWIAARKAGGA